MKKPILLFAIKCSVILYFAACTGINEYTTAVSATPHVINGIWKINLFLESKIDNTTTFEGCTLKFEPSGKITAFKNGEETTGNWAEDDISKKMTINFTTNDPVLSKLNNYWTISDITSSGLSFKNTEDPSAGCFQITNL